MNRNIKSLLHNATLKLQSNLTEEELQAHDGPFVPVVNQNFLRTSPRFLYVGQEPFGWAGSLCDYKGISSLKSLESLYSDFDFGSKYKATPFWSFHRKLAKEIGVEYQGLLWSNLSKYCLSSGKSRKILNSNRVKDIMEVQRGILKAEIEELNIDYVIFVSGPSYDWIIKDEFAECRFEQIDSNFKESAISKVIVPELPNVGFIRTYHPRYLRMKGLESNYLQLISKEINN